MQTHIFNSQIPVSFREDGFLNATAISAHFGKRPNDYLKTEQTQEYIAALADFLSVTNKIVTKENQVVIIKQGGTEQGTWLHPKLAVHFARWLDAKFAVWCDMKIEEILGGQSGYLKISPAQKQQIQQAVEARHRRTGEHWQSIYRKLHQFCRVNSYHEIAAAQFEAAMQFLAATPDTPARAETQKPLRNLQGAVINSLYCAEFIYQHRAAIRGLNRRLAATLHDHAADGIMFLRNVAEQAGISVPDNEYFQYFPWDGSSAEKARYHQLNA